MVASVAAILTVLTARLLAVAAVAPPRRDAASGLGPAARSLDASQDGDLQFHEATFIGSHNAHAALAVAEGFLEPLGANQEDAMIDQLKDDGVRALLLDVMLNAEEYPEEPLRLVHGASFITLDYGGFRTGLGANLIPFLEDDDDAIVSLFLQIVGDVGQDSAIVRAAIYEQLKDIFSSMTVNGVSLKQMTFKYDHELWKDYEDWPTLREIRQSGQRIFVFTDRSEFISSEFGFMHNRQVLQENDWEGIDDCTGRYMWRSGKVSLPLNDYWTRLFFMNHFCCGSGPEAKGNTVGLNLIGGGNNGWGIVYPRIQQCMLSNGGFKPNFIALDWVLQSKEAKEIVDYLNLGGRLGTGQTCTDDSHCATSSCNVLLGICQCQLCPSDRVSVCLGCSIGQYCASGGEEMNSCLYKEGWEPSPIPGANTTGDVPSPSISPTPVPTITNQYCGVDWETTVATCNTATKCPGGNDDCPEGETCFANLDECPEAPTLSPSVKPSYFPSSIPSISQRPIIGWSGWSGLSQIGDNSPTSPAAGDSWLSELGLTKAPTEPTSGPSLTPTKSPFDFSNQNFCGEDYTDAQENCYYTTPCPTGSPAVCGGGTCYSGIVCNAPPSASPTPPPTLRAPPSPPKGSLSNGAPGANQPQGSRPEDGDPWSNTKENEDWDISEFENPPSGMTKSANELMSGPFALSVMSAIGYMVLQV